MSLRHAPPDLGSILGRSPELGYTEEEISGMLKAGDLEG